MNGKDLLPLCLTFGLMFYANSQNFATRKPVWRAHKVDVLRNNRLRVVENNGERVNLNAETNKASLLLVNHEKRLGAQARKNFVQAVDADNNRASANKAGSNAARANAGNHRGTIKTEENEREKIAHLTADRRAKLDTKSVDEGDRFVAQNAKNNWEIDPHRQNENLGTGVLKENGKEFGYEIKNDGRGAVEATLDESERSDNSFLGGLIDNRKKYRCQAQKIGVSTCYDQHGRKVGEVTASENGEVTVRNKWGVEITKARVLKDSDGRPKAIISDGLISAKADNYTEQRCPGSPDNGIKILEPLNFYYKGQRRISGGTRFSWPSCFDIGADIQLPAGISADRVAFEFIVNILPVGRLKCDDIGTCGDDCYYCDWCRGNTRRKQIDLLDNLNTNVCQATGGGVFRATATVCPPAETRTWYLCSNFTKHFTDEYWKKKGDIHAEMRVYERPPHQEFEDKYSNFFTKLIIQGQYAADKATNLGAGSRGNFLNPSRDELKQWYMKKNHKLVACRQALVSYTLAGSKIDAGFLVEAVGATRIFSQPAECNRNPTGGGGRPRPWGTTQAPTTTTRRGGLAGWLGRNIFG